MLALRIDAWTFCFQSVSVCLCLSLSVLCLSVSLGLSGSVWVCLTCACGACVCAPNTTPSTPCPSSLFTSPHTPHPSPQNAAGAMDGGMTVDDPRVARAVRRSFVNELHPDVLEPLILVDARRPDRDEHAQRVPTSRRHQPGSMGGNLYCGISSRSRKRSHR